MKVNRIIQIDTTGEPVLDTSTPVVIVSHEIPQADSSKTVWDVWQGAEVVTGGYSHATEQQAGQWAKEMGYSVHENQV